MPRKSFDSDDIFSFELINVSQGKHMKIARNKNDQSEVMEFIDFAKRVASLNSKERELLGRIMGVRRSLARELARPVFGLLPNGAAVAIATKKPRNINDLLKIRGIGRRRAELVGPAIIAAIAQR